jgi:hypothetical protein
MKTILWTTQRALYSLVTLKGKTRQRAVIAIVVVMVTALFVPIFLAFPSGDIFAHTISPTQNGGPFWPTKSVYVHSFSQNGCYVAGQAQGTASTNGYPYSRNNARPYDGVVVLDFGRPALQNGIYETLLIKLHDYDPAIWVQPHEIQNCVDQYALGFYNATPPLSADPPRLRILVGTSNNYLDDSSVVNHADAYGHGHMWAGLVNNVSAYVRGYYEMSQQITIGAADDIELGWSHFGGTDGVYNWLAGYTGRAAHTIYDYGDAHGCYPSPGASGSFCGTLDWYQGNVWWVATGSPLARAIPEIYYGIGTTPTDVNAQQWQQISLYGYANHAQTLTFWGEMTQYNSCGGCHNTPQEGWTQLQDMLLNNDPIGGHPSSCVAPPSCHRTNANVYHSTDIGDLGSN